MHNLTAVNGLCIADYSGLPGDGMGCIGTIASNNFYLNTGIINFLKYFLNAFFRWIVKHGKA